MSERTIRETFEKGQGILRLIPVFVPRRFSTSRPSPSASSGRLLRPGHRAGLDQGAMVFLDHRSDEWSVGPDDEGMSYVASDLTSQEGRFLFKDACEVLGAGLIGQELLDAHGTWPMYSKFFDFGSPLFHHLHLDDEAAGRVGRIGKPEGYFFPPQLNNHMGPAPYTYFGFDPDVTKEQVKERLLKYEETDNRITELSRAYRIELGTGWFTPPGVVHAPGSVLTYEPQWNSDVNSVYENVTLGEEIYPYEFLSENCPEDRKRDVDYIMSLMDWEKNVDPHYKKTNFCPPIVCPCSDERHTERWVIYANQWIGAKELVIQPGQTVTVNDPVAYGCVMIQGHGKFGAYDAEAACMLRFGQMSADEHFVSEAARREGVTISNESLYEPMVILKHFGPNHPDMPKRAS